MVNRRLLIASFSFFFIFVSMFTFFRIQNGVSSSVPNIPKPTPTPKVMVDNNVRLDYSEGTCSIDTDCTWAGEGCGGGHGVCTNNPQKYKGSVSTCDINQNFPANQNYTCGCVKSVGKCGWKK